MPPESPEIKKLGRYEIERELGRGAMGVVYLARDPVIGRTLALKALAIPAGLDADERSEYYERFVREARAAGGLSHPGIVTVHDAGQDEDNGLSYIAMEYVPGRTLQKRLAAEGPLPEAEALRLIGKIAKAVAYAHGRDIVHRDLKPANLLVAEDGSIKITDFGIARLESSELTREGQSIGSPAYMSPEQVLGRPVDGRSDLFSLGVVLYEMLSGQRPFRGDGLSAVAYQVVHEQPPDLRSLNPSISTGAARIVTGLLAKEPDERYADAADLVEDLRAVVRGKPPTHAPTLSPAAGGTVLDRPDAPPAETPSGTAVDAGPPAWARNVSAAARKVEKLVPQGLSAARALGGRRVWLLLGGTLGLLAVVLLVSLASGGRSPVSVEFRHGLDKGRLRIEVDGSEVVDRRFKGEKKSVRLFGKDLLERQSGVLVDSFRLAPGEHEFRVEVKGKGPSETWSKTVTRHILAGTETTLEIHAGKGLGGGLRIRWDVSTAPSD